MPHPPRPSLHPILAFALPLMILLGMAAHASPPPGLGERRDPSEVEAGTLLVRQADAYREAPAVSTDVVIDVTGIVARTHVRQQFVNPTDDWIEGVYVFPLPERSAVDTLEMQIGERTIVGRIEERAKARATYERAKSEGRKTSLVEQERPNVFTTSFANLGPGETLTVTIAYQEEVRYESGRLSLRFPMVVAPRYVPGTQPITGFSGTGWSIDTDEVPDAARITPPVAHPASSWTHPVRVAVEIDAGFPLTRVSSPTHAIDVEARATGRRSVRLREGTTPANADFVLEWTPVRGAAPSAALFRETREDGEYALLMVLPPSESEGDRTRLSRETIIVVDTSGSMAGASIEQARAAVLRALDTLRPEDAFDVIAFASQPRRLFDAARPATPDALAAARRFVRGLEAEGGTEMAAALDMALAPSREGRAVRQVVFVTDGAVGNERALFDLIHHRLGRSRLYTVGIGSAPNSHFMTKAAAFGRGTFTYIASADAVEREMGALFEKIESPVLHDLVLDWPTASVEAWPERLPDVYAGEPVIVAARLDAPVDRVTLRGRRGGDPLRLEVPLVGGATHSGVARLWARRKVESLMDSLHEGRSLDDVSRSVADLGVAHGLVTRWTSLVAVDTTPTAPVGVTPEPRPVPTHLPAGQVFEKIFGPAARPTAPPGPAPDRIAPLPDARLALAQVGTLDALGRGSLPQGGTPAALLLGLGASALGAGVALRLGVRRAARETR